LGRAVEQGGGEAGVIGDRPIQGGEAADRPCCRSVAAQVPDVLKTKQDLAAAEKELEDLQPYELVTQFLHDGYIYTSSCIFFLQQAQLNE
jgi:hypothetical protein